MFSASSGVSAAKWAHRIRESLLTLAAGLGLLSILAVGAAVLFGLSLIVFKTGSMSPAIPAGAVAIVHQVPATEVAVGDVVTLYRPGVALPVTHRVVTAEPDPTTAGGMLFTMRGDANPVADPVTYSATTAQIVLASIPGGGSFLVWIRNPWVLVCLTAVVTALVTWTFWPHRDPAEAPVSMQRQLR